MANVSFRFNKGIKFYDMDGNLKLDKDGKPKYDPNKPYSIYIRYRVGAKLDFNASIGFKVLEDDWDSGKGTVKNRSAILNRDKIIKKMKKLRLHFDEFDDENEKNGYTPTYKEVKAHFDSYSNEKKVEDDPLTLFAFIDQFIENYTHNPHPITKRLVSKNTLKDYTLTKNTLQLFNDEKYPIDFDSISLDWYYDFVEWCNSKGFKMNYTGKHIKTLKTFLNTALEEGYTTNVAHKSRRFTVYKEETDSIYLNETELLKLWSVDLTDQPRREIARDLFLIGAHTGLRVSDYNRLSKENVKIENGVKMLRIKTKKTGRVVAIPLHPIVEEILKKNNGNPPKRIPDQHINELIKEVAEIAEINDVVEISYNRGGREVTECKPKYALCVTHTARRSFCTNAYLGNVPTLDIMSISGHTTEKNFKKYIKVTAEQTAIKMSEHPYFKNANALKVV